MFSWFRDRRRRKLLAEPFPPWWEATLRKNVAHYPRLSPAEQATLRDVTRVLVAEKTWEGVGGLFVTDEIKVTVAAQAALLLLGIEHDYFARVPSVVVHPHAFRTPVADDGWEDDELSDRISDGMTDHRDPVLVSWDNVLAEGRDPWCGANIVVHEFAHQLDLLDDREVNGVPLLPGPAAEARWRWVMGAALERHVGVVRAGDEPFFPEAAIDLVEFFAYASEAFYCVPADLRAEEPDVYDLLAAYYRVDPMRWFPEGAGGFEANPGLGEPRA